MGTVERDQVKLDHPELAKRVALHWNGGKICGQCVQFSQLGCRQGKLLHSGMNGVCKLHCESGYLKPEREGCSRFERGCS